MSVDGFLTFVGLILALLALASDATRRRLLMHWRSLLLGSLVVLPVIVYLQLFDFLAPACQVDTACSAWILDEQGRRLEPDQAGYLVVLLWLGFILWRIRPRRLQPRHLPQLSGLVGALAEEGRFSELCRIAGPELAMVERVASGQEDGAPPDQEAAAAAIQRLMYRQANLVRFIALERPRLAVSMMARSQTIVFDFSDDVLTTLISTPGSPLYAEVQANQNTAWPGYAHIEHNTYLHFLFANAARARDLGAWQPVMETVIESLRQARATGYAEFLNGPAGRFPDDGRWKDQTFVGIRFLDLMVSAALVQGIEDHMWLFYTGHVIAPLLDLYDETRPGVNAIDETPTRASYLIQQLFSMQLRWIESIERLPEGAPHLRLQSAFPTSEPANIPKSAILAMAGCLEAVLTTDAVPTRSRRTIADMVFRTLSGMPDEGPRAGFRAAMVAALVEPDDHREPYLLALRELLDGFDQGLQGGVTDLNVALRTVMRY